MTDKAHRLNINGHAWSPRQLARGALLRLASEKRIFERVRNVNGIFLTFDDGPHETHTPYVLDALQKAQAKATFFVVGKQCRKYPAIVRRIVDEGHAIGNHTFEHANPSTVSSFELIAEIELTDKVLLDVAGVTTDLFRPPFGKLTLGKFLAVSRQCRRVALWNIDPKDYSRGVADTTQWLFDVSLRGGDVILMHDIHPHTATIVDKFATPHRGHGIEFLPLPINVNRS